MSAAAPTACSIQPHPRRTLRGSYPIGVALVIVVFVGCSPAASEDLARLAGKAVEEVGPIIVKAAEHDQVAADKIEPLVSVWSSRLGATVDKLASVNEQTRGPARAVTVATFCQSVELWETNRSHKVEPPLTSDQVEAIALVNIGRQAFSSPALSARELAQEIYNSVWQDLNAGDVNAAAIDGAKLAICDAAAG